MSLRKKLANLSLGVAALLTFRFNRQLRKQNHDLEGKLLTQSEELHELKRLSDAHQRTQGELRSRSEQLEELQVKFPWW